MKESGPKHYNEKELRKMGYNPVNLNDTKSMPANYTKTCILGNGCLNKIMSATPKKGDKGELVYEIPEKYFLEGDAFFPAIALMKKEEKYFVRGTLLQTNGISPKKYYFTLEDDFKAELIEPSEIEKLLIKF